MTDATDTNPELLSADVAHLCDQLRIIRVGLEALGVQTFILDHTIAKLQNLDKTARQYEASEPYRAGYVAGRDAAFATGLTGDQVG